MPTPPNSSTQLVSPIIGPSSGEAIAEVASASGAAPTTLRLEASALRDLKWMSELFSEILLPADANELLNIPQKEMRKVAVNCLIRICFFL